MPSFLAIKSKACTVVEGRRKKGLLCDPGSEFRLLLSVKAKIINGMKIIIKWYLVLCRKACGNEC